MGEKSSSGALLFYQLSSDNQAFWGSPLEFAITITITSSQPKLQRALSLNKKQKGKQDMAGGSFGPTGVAKERAEQYQGRVTAYVIVACIVAAVGGSIFGYDIGISGNFKIPLFYLILHAAGKRTVSFRRI